MIPHDFGTNPVKLIDSLDALKSKIDLMEALIQIEIATSLMSAQDGQGEENDPICVNYKKLQTEIIPIDDTTEDWQVCHKYVKNQQGMFDLEIQHIFKVLRNGEEDRFNTMKHLGNRQLLWHGSRVTNYVGILSQGLRIAPPEAPVSGYRFGKGVYFADLCEKSAGYCRGQSSDEILMMLVEVTLGTTKDLKHDQYMEKAMTGSHSTKALGAIAPSESTTIENGEILVPYGPPKPTGIASSCQHNEFIVYNINQARIRYLLRLKLKTK